MKPGRIFCMGYCMRLSQNIYTCRQTPKTFFSLQCPFFASPNLNVSAYYVTRQELGILEIFGLPMFWISNQYKNCVICNKNRHFFKIKLFLLKLLKILLRLTSNNTSYFSSISVNVLVFNNLVVS